MLAKRSKQRKEQIANKLLDKFDDDPVADGLNLVNEIMLNKTMSRIVRQESKNNKPIDTSPLLKSSKKKSY